MRSVLIFSLAIGMLFESQAQLVSWTGQGDNRTWDDEDNWSQEDGPEVGDSVLIENIDTVYLDDENVEALVWLKLVEVVLVVSSNSELGVTNAASDGIELIESEVINFGKILISSCQGKGIKLDSYSKLINNDTILIERTEVGLEFELSLLNFGSIRVSESHEGIRGIGENEDGNRFENHGFVSIRCDRVGISLSDMNHVINSGNISINNPDDGFILFGSFMLNLGDIEILDVVRALRIDLVTRLTHQIGEITLEGRMPADPNTSIGLRIDIGSVFECFGDVSINGFATGVDLITDSVWKMNSGKTRVTNSGQHAVFGGRSDITIGQAASLSIDRMFSLFTFLDTEDNLFECFGEFIVH